MTGPVRLVAGAAWLAACAPPSDRATTAARTDPSAPPPVLVAAVAPTGSDEALDPGYTAVGRRDPFRAPVISRPDAGPCVLGHRRFSVDQFMLVATVFDAGSSFAMVRDPEDVGYLVRRGSRFGCERAEVVRIGPMTIDVVVRDRAGAPRRVSLGMRVAARNDEPLDLSGPEGTP